MKKIVSFCLALLLFTLPLFSAGCALNTEGLLEAAPALIEKSAFYNEIYFGRGIPYDSLATPMGVYYPAQRAYLTQHGIETVEKLKAATALVFSAGYCQTIFQGAFSGFAAEGVVGAVYARYSSSQAANDRDENETILVSTTDWHLQNPIGRSTYDYSTLRLGEVGGSYAYVYLTVTTVFGEDTDSPSTSEEEMRIKFVYENGWRIDSPTY